MYKQRGVLLWIFGKHAVDAIEGNVDGPGDMPLPILIGAAYINQYRAFGRLALLNTFVDIHPSKLIKQSHDELLCSLVLSLDASMSGRHRPVP